MTDRHVPTTGVTTADIPASDHAPTEEVVHFRPRRKRTQRELTSLTLNLAPMVDVVFLLLIFFIVTTTFKKAEGVLPSRLPSQGGVADQYDLPITPITVHVIGKSDSPTEYEITVEHFVNRPTTFNELSTFLNEIQANPGFDDETPVIIRSADDVLWDHVVGCWNAAVRAGCKRISFGTE